jgi:hypothetical protein
MERESLLCPLPGGRSMPGFAAGPRFAYGLPLKPSAEGRDLAEVDSPHGRRPRALVFDSGLGGLSVLREIGRLRPDVEIAYVADDAAFPYGRLSEAELIARVETVMARVIPAHEPDIVVVACSTASTLALPRLRPPISTCRSWEWFQRSSRPHARPDQG